MDAKAEDKTSPPTRWPRVLLLPGWLDSGPGHWQTRWEAAHGFERVQQSDWAWPRRGDWMARLDEVVADAESGAPLLLAAHSLGCHLVAAWAARTRHAAKLRAALLVAPPDLARADLPPPLVPWRPAERQRLPFAAVVVASEDDPFCAAPAARALAGDWGAGFVSAGAAGHLNADSGLGDWPEGLALLARLAGR